MDQLSQYVPVLILAVVAIGFAFGTLILWSSWEEGQRSLTKDTPYECGMIPQGAARAFL
jgi:NADH:ubiquinone oxidoreductase subunit 3 (subunit A)